MEKIFESNSCSYTMCRIHNLREDLLCSCSDYICSKCVNTHTIHTDFAIRNKDEIKKLYSNNVEEIKKSIKYLSKKQLDISIIELNVKKANNDFLENLNFLTEEDKKSINSVITHMNDLKVNDNEKQMNNFIKHEYKDKMIAIAFKKCDKIGKMNKLINDSMDKFKEEYCNLLKKYFCTSENEDSLKNICVGGNLANNQKNDNEFFIDINNISGYNLIKAKVANLNEESEIPKNEKANESFFSIKEDLNNLNNKGNFKNNYNLVDKSNELTNKSNYIDFSGVQPKSFKSENKFANENIHFNNKNENIHFHNQNKPISHARDPNPSNNNSNNSNKSNNRMDNFTAKNKIEKICQDCKSKYEVFTADQYKIRCLSCYKKFKK